MANTQDIAKSYELAKDIYAGLGVDTDKAIETLKSVAISVHCWQGDDVAGFETLDPSQAIGGMQVTGNHPGRARNADELRSDFEKAKSLIPGNHRFNLHAIYGEFGGMKVDRDEIAPEHFAGWVQWAKANNLKLDFNSTCFGHPKAASGFTLSDKDKSIRDFWVEHVKRCRLIGAYMGKEQNSACIHNIWLPDGAKDITVDRMDMRKNLKGSLDNVFSVAHNPLEIKDSVECKLFGIGSEYFVVGSHEFYMGYALLNKLMVCLDMGHFHPTESIADKISSLLLYCDEIVMHISRGIRWDSDHVVTLNDDVRAVMEEIVRNEALNRVHLSLDYFDASINRIGAWVIGARAALKAILAALLEPTINLRKIEADGRNFERLALLEELKTLPLGSVWDYYCLKSSVPVRTDWIDDINKYEADVTGKRK